jgi:hypothetical protein
MGALHVTITAADTTRSCAGKDWPEQAVELRTFSPGITMALLLACNVFGMGIKLGIMYECSRLAMLVQFVGAVSMMVSWM